MADGLFGQGVLDGMPERLYACTPTRLATWRSCPRLYRFSYLDRPQPPKGPPWAHHSVGAATHVALAQWFGLRRGRRTPAAGADLLRRNWLHEGFRDEAQSAAARGRAAAWVERYLAGPGVPAAEPVGVERTLTATTSGLVLGGRADRLDVAPDGSVVVVDYKTGRRAPTGQDALDSLALAAYVLGVRRTLRRSCTRVELHHLPTATVAVGEHTAASLDARLAEAEELGAAAAAADDAFALGRTGDDLFGPRPSPSCTWCDFRRNCPEGRAASAPAQPWDGLRAQGA